MKLIIQIPCFNEEATLPQTLADLPKSIPGISKIETQVIDDGSTDRTVEVAAACGVDHIIRQGTNRGLAATFMAGIKNALSCGADIVVNTDGDNQYRGEDIAKLVAPIIEDRADFVVGCRPIAEHEEFGIVKKFLQLVGSWVLRRISKTNVRDAASGFRAFSRHACARLFVHSRFSYCMETLIQAGNSGLRVVGDDIRVNPKTRESRLFRSIPEYVRKQAATMLAMALLYRPLAFFNTLAAPFFLASFGLGIRYMYLKWVIYPDDPTRTFIPSLILLAVLSVLGTGLVLAGLFSSLFVAQRRLIESVLTNQLERR
ncbi:MAG: glycosyltransferase family 2 protein [Verrucomicrobia bacterium]|nr:MAG: glycosyltransferase family 2 protein [Verrucomicrobiota bacterium]